MADGRSHNKMAADVHYIPIYKQSATTFFRIFEKNPSYIHTTALKSIILVRQLFTIFTSRRRWHNLNAKATYL